jgi:hypothetical protein
MTWGRIRIVFWMVALALVMLLWNYLAEQNRRLATLNADLANLSQKVEAGDAVIAKLEQRRIALTRDLQTMTRAALKMRRQESGVHTVPEAATRVASDADSGRLADNMSHILKDPGMIGMVREYTTGEISNQYAPLSARLNLAPEAAGKLYSVLAAHDLSVMEQCAALGTRASGEAVSNVLVCAFTEKENQLQSLLGADGYTRYQEFTERLPDQLLVEQWKADFAEHPLSAEQQQLLLQLTKGESAETANGGTAKAEDLSPAGAVAQFEQEVRRQEEIDQRVRERAGGFLSAEQLGALATWQTNRLTGLQMKATFARKAFELPSDGTSPGARAP